MSGLYALAIIGSLCGLATLDYRYGVALFADWRRTLKTVGTMVCFFLAWDIAGIAAGIFYQGKSALLLGPTVLPNVPIEELLFLTLLCYLALLLTQWSHRDISATE